MSFFAGSEVGVECYLSLVEWFDFFLVEVPRPSCGKPEVVWDKSGGDDGVFFAFGEG